MDSDAFANELKQGVETFRQQSSKDILNKVLSVFSDSGKEAINAYSVGNFFHGSYVGENGAVYNGRSLSVEVNGLGRRSLVRFAGYIAKLVHPETVLVKDLNTKKIFLVSSVTPMRSLLRQRD